MNQFRFRFKARFFLSAVIMFKRFLRIVVFSKAWPSTSFPRPTFQIDVSTSLPETLKHFAPPTSAMRTISGLWYGVCPTIGSHNMCCHECDMFWFNESTKRKHLMQALSETPNKTTVGNQVFANGKKA